MKARVLVRLKPGIMDVQGAAVKRALAGLGFSELTDLRVGKVIDIDLEHVLGSCNVFQILGDGDVLQGVFTRSVYLPYRGQSWPLVVDNLDKPFAEVMSLGEGTAMEITVG